MWVRIGEFGAPGIFRNLASSLIWDFPSHLTPPPTPHPPPLPQGELLIQQPHLLSPHNELPGPQKTFLFPQALTVLGHGSRVTALHFSQLGFLA